ncbi:MAG: hypothetical protein WKF91_10020 [Segetibacter sp.]
MKKLVAILLLVVFLFNLVGYRGWFYMAEQQWEAQLRNLLDKEQYNDAELITIRVPLLLPYVTDTREFQRTDGEINMNGKIYHYVKSKIENGDYVLMCLPDHNKQQLKKAKEDFFRDANELLQNGSSKKSGSSKSGLFKHLLSEYNCNSLSFNHVVINNGSRDYNIHSVEDMSSPPPLSPFQPPEIT